VKWVAQIYKESSRSTTGVGNQWYAWHAKQFLLARRSSKFYVSILLWFTRSIIDLDLCKTDVFGIL